LYQTENREEFKQRDLLPLGESRQGHDDFIFHACAHAGIFFLPRVEAPPKLFYPKVLFFGTADIINQETFILNDDLNEIVVRATLLSEIFF
jgi:hypothetical protein